MNDRSRAREVDAFSYIQKKENRWLLTKDLDREMETLLLFIDLLCTCYSLLMFNDDRYIDYIEFFVRGAALVTVVTCYGLSNLTPCDVHT